jgi:putative endonuclease
MKGRDESAAAEAVSNGRSWPPPSRPCVGDPRVGTATPKKDVDGRDKPGHDGGNADATEYRMFMQRGGWVYIMTNRRNGTLYIGVTSNLSRRIWEHREGLVAGFTKAYGLERLVWYERHDDIRLAIQREKSMKRWPRAWKVRLIHGFNPEWDDLYEMLNW